MIPQMTNEQFALWIASAKHSTTSDVIKIADKYYEWLETKRKKSGFPNMQEMMDKTINNVAKKLSDETK